MKITIKSIAFILLLTIAQFSFGQSDKEKALSKAQEAIELMDNGKFDESIKLLAEAQKLDPKKFTYQYEMAYAYYAKEDYKKALEILDEIKNHKDVSDRLFQLLGNCYDVLGESDKAFEVYNDGLKKFPNSGEIYLEMGNVHWGKEEYGKALSYYEKGIEVDPKFSSNYYRATLIYCGSSEKLWGLIYGEVFMNIERNSKRTAEISKLLYDTYKKEIKITDETSMTCSFCQQMTMDVNSISDSKNFKLPFCMVFEPVFLMSMIFEKNIDINSLDRIRGRFIDSYFKNNHDKTYPNILFSYQKKLKDAGHFEAYNHWILMKGDEDGFTEWQTKNKDKWDLFVKWFTENGLEIDSKTKFHK